MASSNNALVLAQRVGSQRDGPQRDGSQQRPKPTLSTLPVSIQKEIASHLPAVWILAYSQTCRPLYEALSFRNANDVWFAALPPVLWDYPEQHQCHTERLEESFRKIYDPLVREYAVWKLAEVRSANVMRGSDVVPQYHEILLGLSGKEKADLYERARPQIIAARAPGVRKLHIGHVYDPDFNYKREIIGHLKSRRRCVLCLKSDRSEVRCTLRWRWGLLWCPACLSEYSIATDCVRTILPPLWFPPTVDRQVIRHHPNCLTEYYFRPEIEELVINRIGFSVSVCELAIKRQQTQVRHLRLQHSTAEGRRRRVRWQLIFAAQQLWEGEDPYPIVHLEPITNIITTERHPGLPDADTYRVYRETFAPTNELVQFLFAPAAMSEQPSEVPYHPASGWLADPTKALKTQVQIDTTVTSDWLRVAALAMLDKLTDWDPDPEKYDKYFAKGRGGYVDMWREMAIDWHLQRLEKEVSSGECVRMVHVEPAWQYKIQFYRNALDIRPDHMMPVRPVHGLNMTDEEWHQFMQRDQAVTQAEREREDRIKTFNRLIRHCSFRCPVDLARTQPRGLVGFVKHMFHFHPELFWSGQFHCGG